MCIGLLRTRRSRTRTTARKWTRGVFLLLMHLEKVEEGVEQRVEGTPPFFWCLRTKNMFISYSSRDSTRGYFPQPQNAKVIKIRSERRVDSLLGDTISSTLTLILLLPFTLLLLYLLIQKG